MHKDAVAREDGRSSGEYQDQSDEETGISSQESVQESLSDVSDKDSFESDQERDGDLSVSTKEQLEDKGTADDRRCFICQKDFANPRSLASHKSKFHKSIQDGVKSEYSDYSSDENSFTESNVENSTDSKKRFGASLEKFSKRTKKTHDGGEDNPSSSSSKYLKRKENMFKYLCTPITSAYKFKKFFKVPHAKESLNLNGVENSLIDCIMSIGPLQEVAGVMKENPKEVQSIYKQIYELCNHLNKEED